jgi:flagellar hook-basal body complex protein FliE
MSVGAIGGLPSLPQLPSVNGAAGATGPKDAAAAFGDMVTNGLENLQEVQGQADKLAQQAATGELTDLHDYMITSTQAQLQTELTVAVRNKAVESFNDIMRMQI